nr:aldo/keto reductase [Sphingobacterium sp. E70]
MTPELITKLSALNEVAMQREQSLAQMAIAWLLKDERLTSVLVGARNSEQLTDSLKSLDNLSFSTVELDQIAHILATT